MANHTAIISLLWDPEATKSNVTVKESVLNGAEVGESVIDSSQINIFQSIFTFTTTQSNIPVI